jgi:hypothetical protein
VAIRSIVCRASWLVLTMLSPLTAQQAPTDLPRLAGEVVLDGRPDEAAWQSVAPLPLTMYTPLFRGAPTESSEIRIAYDRDHLYASGRLFDSEPSEIRINSLHRDRWSGDDFFVLLVDSFNDNQSVRRFGTTPAGTRIDELIGADGADRNLSWDARWDVVTARDEHGWYFEMRIPFASLRFPGNGEQVVMGITASRLIARKNERTTWPEINPAVAFDRPSATRDVVLRNIHSSRPVLVTPYALGGMSRLPAGPTTGPTDGIGEAGVDVKYSLSDNLFLDLSLNTDFAQVEADDQQINLTRFPLFFPEKRQFFQERSDLFLYDFGSGGRLFHSRRIGLSDDARPVRILGGARIAGTTGPWSFGLLDMQSDEDRGRPGENFGVARVRRRLFNASSYLGGMVTSRVSTEGDRSLAGGFDASLQLPNNHYATARFAATSRDDPAAAFDLADNSQLYLAWERRNARGFSYHLKVNRIGESFTPDVGFLPRRDATFGSLYAVHNVSGARGDRLQSYGPGIVAFAWRSNATKDLENYYVAHWWNYELWNGGNGFLQVTTRLDQLPAPLPIGEATVPSGDHKTTNLWFYYQSGPGSRLRTVVSARAGGLYDGRHLELFVRPTWNLSRHVELGADLENTLIRFSERDEAVNVHVARLRLRAAADARLSAAALVQYNSLAHLVGVNLRFRYNVREGTDIWLVYDEGLNTERSLDGTPEALPLSASRSVRAKVTYTFGL